MTATPASGVLVVDRPVDLSRAVKPVDSWWTVIAIDPLAVRVLPLLVRLRRVTPNAVTAVAALAGAVAVVLFGTGHLRLGAAVYEVRFFLDCLDGKLARVRGTSSAGGAAFDRLADAVTIPAAYAAVGLWLARGGHLDPRLVLLVALMSTVVTVVEVFLELLRAKVPTAPAAEPAPGGAVAGWLRRHRLTLRPWTVELETAGLFLGPLVLGAGPLAAVQVALAIAYGGCVVVDLVFIRAAAKTAVVQ